MKLWRGHGLESAQRVLGGTLVRPPILSRIMDAFHFTTFLQRLINGINLDRPTRSNHFDGRRFLSRLCRCNNRDEWYRMNDSWLNQKNEKIFISLWTLNTYTCCECRHVTVRFFFRKATLNFSYCKFFISLFFSCWFRFTSFGYK